jgi:hypothetical protein
MREGKKRERERVSFKIIYKSKIPNCMRKGNLKRQKINAILEDFMP